MRLSRSFFNRDTNVVARELLGKKIVRILDNEEKIEAIITETEAYHGFYDKASHASRKKTERNKIMFDKAGLTYVYLIYGMHHCLNFTTMPEGFPAAVLIRAVAQINSKSEVLNSKQIQNHKLQIKNKPKDPNDLKNPNNFTPINGPGRVCKTLQIDKSFYGEDLSKSKRIWVENTGERGCKSKKYDIIASKRVGVDYAEESAELLWNYKINF